MFCWEINWWYFWLSAFLAMVAPSHLLFQISCPRTYRYVEKWYQTFSVAIICVLGFCTFAFAFYGFSTKEQPKTFIEALYESVRLFALNVDTSELQDSPALGWAMVFECVLAVLIAKGGVTLLFHDSYQKVRLFFARRHVIICGLGRIGQQLLQDMNRVDKKKTDHGAPVAKKQSLPSLVVAIEADERHPQIPWARSLGAIVIIGDATKGETLTEAGIGRASEVFVVTGSDESNIESVIEIRDSILEYNPRWWLRERTLTSPLKCHVHIVDRELTNATRLRSTKLERPLSTEDPKKKQPPRGIKVDVFNAVERTARRLLEEIANSSVEDKTGAKVPMRPTIKRKMDTALHDEPPRHYEVAHYVILGFGEFGQSLALQLAELAHFENGKRLRLTIVDSDIEKLAKPFIARNPRFCAGFDKISGWKFDEKWDDWSNTIDSTQDPPFRKSLGVEYVCNAQFIEYLEGTDDEFLRAMNREFSTGWVKPAIIVCFELDRKSFAIAERMKNRLDTMGDNWPIFVWIPRQRELSELLLDLRDHPTDQSKKGSPLIPFGQCFDSVSYKDVIDGWYDRLARLVRLAWEQKARGAEAIAVGEFLECLTSTDKKDDVPDVPQFPPTLDWASIDRAANALWEDCDEWERASNRSAAIHAVVKLAYLGVRITNGLLPSDPCVALPIPRLKLDGDQLQIMEHNRWVAERLLCGWSYSPGRDNARKTRWQITSWENLDIGKHIQSDANPQRDERTKDIKIVKLILALVNSGRLEVTRR